MKILIYAPIFPPVVGGPATQGFHLCRVLLKNGDKPVVVTMGDKFEKKSPDGYPVYRYPWRYTGTPIDKIIRPIVFPFFYLWVLKKEKPDIVHSNNVATLSFFVGFISNKMGVPSITKYGGEWVWETLSSFKMRNSNLDELYKESRLARFLWKIERKGLSYFDAIWTPSESRAREVKELVGYKKDVFVIYNSMDLPTGGFVESKPEDEFVIVTASRFIPHKRLPLIIKAFKELNNPNSKLVIIGEGEETEVVKKFAKDLGVDSKVEFTGRLFGQPIYDQFKKASVYVSASLEEGFPNVFVEAAHFGLPIVSSNVGGCNEIVKDGFNGYLYEVFDEDSLFKHVKKLDEDRDLRNIMAKNSFEFSSRYDLNVTIKQFMEMYSKAKENYLKNK